MKKYLIILIVCFQIFGCGLAVNYMPKTTTVNNAKSGNHFITIFQINEKLPDNYTVIGSVSVGEAGMTIECGYEDVINAAKTKARSVGGDAIQIVQLKTPDFLGSTCYNLIANVLIDNKSIQ